MATDAKDGACWNQWSDWDKWSNRRNSIGATSNWTREQSDTALQEQRAALTEDKKKQHPFHLKKAAFDQEHLPWNLTGANVVMKEPEKGNQPAGGGWKKWSDRDKWSWRNSTEEWGTDGARSSEAEAASTWTREKSELPPEVVQEQLAALTTEKIKQIVDQLRLNGGTMPVNLLGARFHLKKAAFDQEHLPWLLSGASVVMKDTETGSQPAGGMAGSGAAGSVPEFLLSSIAGKVTISETCGKHPKTILSELWQKKCITKSQISGNIGTGFQVEANVLAGANQGRYVGHAKARDKKMAEALASENLLEKIAESGIDIKSVITEQAHGGVDGPGGVKKLGAPGDSAESTTRSGGGGAPSQRPPANWVSGWSGWWWDTDSRKISSWQCSGNERDNGDNWWWRSETWLVDSSWKSEGHGGDWSTERVRNAEEAAPDTAGSAWQADEEEEVEEQEEDEDEAFTQAQASSFTYISKTAAAGALGAAAPPPGSDARDAAVQLAESSSSPSPARVLGPPPYSMLHAQDLGKQADVELANLCLLCLSASSEHEDDKRFGILTTRDAGQSFCGATLDVRAPDGTRWDVLLETTDVAPERSPYDTTLPALFHDHAMLALFPQHSKREGGAEKSCVPTPALLVQIKSDAGKTQLDWHQMDDFVSRVNVRKLFEQDGEEVDVGSFGIAQRFDNAPWLAPCLRRWYCMNDLHRISTLGPTFPIDPEAMEATFAPRAVEEQAGHVLQLLGRTVLSVLIEVSGFAKSGEKACLSQAVLAKCMQPWSFAEYLVMQGDAQWQPPGATLAEQDIAQVTTDACQVQMMEAFLGSYFLSGGGFYAALGILRYLLTRSEQEQEMPRWAREECKGDADRFDRLFGYHLFGLNGAFKGRTPTYTTVRERRNPDGIKELEVEYENEDKGGFFWEGYVSSSPRCDEG